MTRATPKTFRPIPNARARSRSMYKTLAQNAAASPVSSGTIGLEKEINAAAALQPPLSIAAGGGGRDPLWLGATNPPDQTPDSFYIEQLPQRLAFQIPENEDRPLPLDLSPFWKRIGARAATPEVAATVAALDPAQFPEINSLPLPPGTTLATATPAELQAALDAANPLLNPDNIYIGRSSAQVGAWIPGNYSYDPNGPTAIWGSPFAWTDIATLFAQPNPNNPDQLLPLSPDAANDLSARLYEAYLINNKYLLSAIRDGALDGKRFIQPPNANHADILAHVAGLPRTQLDELIAALPADDAQAAELVAQFLTDAVLKEGVAQPATNPVFNFDILPNHVIPTARAIEPTLTGVLPLPDTTFTTPEHQEALAYLQDTLTQNGHNEGSFLHQAAPAVAALLAHPTARQSNPARFAPLVHATLRQLAAEQGLTENQDPALR